MLTSNMMTQSAPKTSWVIAPPELAAPPSSLLRDLALGLEGASKPDAAQQTSGHIVGTVNAANVSSFSERYELFGHKAPCNPKSIRRGDATTGGAPGERHAAHQPL